MSNPTLEIAKKEFLEHVVSWRFLIALVLSTLILVTSVVALATAYREDAATFAANQEELARMDPTFSKTLLETNEHVAKPNLLSIFVGGAGDAYRARAGQAEFGGIERGAEYAPEGGSNSPTNTRFDPLDLGFVAVVVMTFMAVLFSFDAVSGEKERGTLKLMLANPVPKDSVLLGKYLGGMASITLPLVVALVIGIAVLQFMDVRVDGEAWGRLAIVAAVMLALLSAFYLLGLVVSSLSKRSSTSLLALTLVWLILVFGVGNVAAVAAKASTDAMTNAELQEAYRAIDDRTQAEFGPIQDELFPLFQKRFRGNLSAEEQARMDDLTARDQAIADRARADRDAVTQQAQRQLDDQLRAAETVSSISPAEAFRTLATALAHSDYWSFRDAASAAEEYQREVDRGQREWQEDNPNTPGNAIVIVGPGAVRATSSGNNYQPPDMNYEPASVKEQLSSAAGMRDMLVLLGYNLIAFVGAYVAFLRYDVR